MYQSARFIIYYKSGNTKTEDRSDPKAWDNAPKFEYKCQECGETFPCFKEVPMTYCLKCANENKDVELVRQTIISALGVQFDPIPLQETIDEKSVPVMSSEPGGQQLRVNFSPFVFKGSSVWNYGWMQEKLAEQQFVGGHKKFIHGIRLTQILNPEGLCSCLVCYLNKGIPTSYSYVTNIFSLGMDESALEKLHGIKLSECGKRIVTKKGEPIKQTIITNLGERTEQ